MATKINSNQLNKLISTHLFSIDWKKNLYYSLKLKLVEILMSKLILKNLLSVVQIYIGLSGCS
jgi:hypothetical protein